MVQKVLRNFAADAGTTVLEQFGWRGLSAGDITEAVWQSTMHTHVTYLPLYALVHIVNNMYIHVNCK